MCFDHLYQRKEQKRNASNVTDRCVLCGRIPADHRLWIRCFYVEVAVLRRPIRRDL